MITTPGAPNWIKLRTPDPDAAAVFYAQVFGWTAQQLGPDLGGDVMFLRNGLPIAGCTPNDGSKGPNTWGVYLHSPDVDETARRALAAGGHVLVEPRQMGDLGRMAIVMDSAGAPVGAWQPLTHPGLSVRGEPFAPAWFETLSMDYPAALAFYREVFDWDIHVMSDTPEFRYATLGEGETALAGIMDATTFLPEESPSHWQFYVQVPDADQTVRAVERAGGSVGRPPHDTDWGRIGQMIDPAGVSFSILAPTG